MKVVLLKDVPGFGNKYEAKEVATGYARNFLIPRKMAQVATAALLREFEKLRVEKEKQQKKEIEEIQQVLLNLQKKTLKLSARANEKGGLFAKIQAKEIAEALSEKAGKTIPANLIVLSRSIETTGKHSFSVRGAGEELTFTIVVEKEK